MKIINLIPMAGNGMRFKNVGYSTPKPLIPVDGKPMIVKAIESLPKASLNILIVRKDVLNIESLKKTLFKYFENIKIIGIDHLTDGQASTCLIAENFIDNKCILNIGTCDTGFKIDNKKYLEMINLYDSFIWTYRNNLNVINNPKMYGWVMPKSNSNEVEYISCKKPISDNILNDHVISGTFTFKNPSLFFESIRLMKKKEDKVNGEFYLDNIFNHIDKPSGIFEVEKTFSWGTPDELNNYLNGNEKI